MYMGAIGYVDYYLLLSLTITSMTHLLKITEKFSQQFNVENYQLFH